MMTNLVDRPGRLAKIGQCACASPGGGRHAGGGVRSATTPLGTSQRRSTGYAAIPQRRSDGGRHTAMGGMFAEPRWNPLRNQCREQPIDGFVRATPRSKPDARVVAVGQRRRADEGRR